MINILFLLALFSTSSSIVLRCSFNIHFISAFGRLAYVCTSTFGESWNSTHVVGVSGVHRDGFTNADVEVVRISNCQRLTAVPRGFQHFFPIFSGFHLLGCGINSLNGDEVDEYPNLRWFALEYTQLEFIPGNFFKNNPLLTSTSFGANRIKRVGVGLLDDLRNLHRLYFFNNVCGNQGARNEAEVQELIDVLRTQCSDDS